MAKYFDLRCEYKFKMGDIVTCVVSTGKSTELKLGRKYKVIKSYSEYGADQVDVESKNGRIISGCFASRFTTLKIERNKKLQKINEYSSRIES